MTPHTAVGHWEETGQSKADSFLCRNDGRHFTGESLARPTLAQLALGAQEQSLRLAGCSPNTFLRVRRTRKIFTV